MRANRISNRIWARVFTVCVMIACLFLLLWNSTAHVFAAEEEQNTYLIDSAEALATYSQAYYEGNRNPRDVLNISIGSGSAVTNKDFVSLGTADRPFAGTLIIPTSGVDVFQLFNCPLFNYVSTDMTISGAGTVKIMRAAILEASTADVLTGGALFANHVTAGTNAASWTISLIPYTGDGSSASSFEGLIGEIAAGCNVTVNFQNTANLAVSGSGNLGYICGTLGAGASLNVTTSGSGSSLSVSSSGGHAGGLVGMMGAGASLKFNSANNTRVTSVQSTSGYAGGIVGYVGNVTGANDFSFAAGVTDYAVSGSVTGTSGAGGLFGYYRSTLAAATFTLEDTYAIASGMTISATDSAGGVFGYLVNEGASFSFDGNASGSETLQVALPNGTARGGVCGKYGTNALTNTLGITNTETQITANTASPTTERVGGLIGLVTDSPAYIAVSGVSCASAETSDSNCPGGGLIGDAGSGGSFVDVSGNITISGRFYAGLIENLPQGVLRVQGVTDLSAYRQHNATRDLTSGTIVRRRSRSLIYALGTGANAGWTLKRYTAGVNNIDDVYSWGQVIRVDGTKLTESALFTVDSTAHTVTVKSGVTTMNNENDFAKTALNIKLGTEAGAGALLFQTANQSATLLSSTLTLGGDINLTGTGILGLTRDDGSNAAFSGTLNGGNYTVTLALGEVYGVDGSGNALSSARIDGYIRRHIYNGLFAKTNGATVQNLKLAGSCYILQDVDNTYLAGISAYATGGLTLTNVTATALQLTYKMGTNYTTYVGGAVGWAGGNNLNLTVSGGTYRPTVTDTTEADKSGGKVTYVGGVIGYIGNGTTQTVTFNNSATIGISYTKSINTRRESCFGSAIAGMSNQAYAKNKRVISLTGVTVNMTASGTAVSGKRFGGILGTEWFSADVTLNGLTVASASITANAVSANFGGLVQAATGYWNVASVSLTSADFALKATGSTFGFIANQTWSNSGSNTALYLEVDNTGSNYDIAALSFEDSTGTFTCFDEIVADSRFNGQNIANNGNSVISIKTSGNVLNTSGSPNTYFNKTTYGQTANGAVNPNTRYYYNIGYAVTNRATAKYNLLVWSVKEYAHTCLSAWFENPSATFTGDLDMTGLSYYPIDLKSNVSFSNATVKLDNITMEANVKYAYSGEAGTRTTRSATNQHYLMHAALFRNATADIGVSTVNLQGNVPKISDAFCGYLVAGTLGGTNNPLPTTLTVSGLVLDGAYISNGNAYFTDTSYAPFLVNKVSGNSTVTVEGASQSTTAYASLGANHVASSLIGDVGDTSAQTIRLSFSEIVFDGRSSAASIGNMNTTYGTSRSIFSRATLLNSFLYASESSGSYNFEIDEDWSWNPSTETATAIHEVTYGKEITSSTEHTNKQKKYIGSEYYTHPTAYQSASQYDFSTGFLPYVYVAANLAEYKHELSINVTYSSAIGGFGKYDQPYIIDDGEKLAIISKIIKGDNVGNTVEIYLPDDLTDYDYTATGYDEYKYNFGTSTFSSSNGGADQTNANVRRYLAGAYYLIKEDIELPANYESLGQTTNTNPEYAFRGVIVGSGEGKEITNYSAQPLIYSSNGCVLKNLTVVVAVDVSGSHNIALSSGVTDYAYSGGQASYGALIRQIMGGDTIIDNVEVTFENNVTFSLSAGDSNKTRLIPVGGYVGTLFNGGLIFRNVNAGNTGLTSANFSAVTDAGYLYVNPIIGRVIAGYAFREANAYAVESVFSNGSKNYVISDLSLSESKLTITENNGQYTVTVPNGQAVYVLGAIVNSGAASANHNNSTDQAYAALSDFWQAYRAHTTTRAGAAYSGIGTSSGADYTAACGDRYSTDLKGVPYIVSAYTYNTGSVHYARSLASRSNTIISVTGNCNVASGFRGIGSIYSDASYSTDRVHLRIESMTGTNNPVITLHMSFSEYDSSVTAYKAQSVEKWTAAEANMMIADNAGFGFFNRLVMNGSGYVEEFTLSGSIVYKIYGVNTGTEISYDLNNVKGHSVLNVGALAGSVYSGSTSGSNIMKIRNVSLQNLSVQGGRFAGGLVGCFASIVNNSSANVIETCPVSNLTVRAGKAAGGYIGYANVGGNSDQTTAPTLTISGDATLEGGVSRKTEVALATVAVFGTADTWMERLNPAAGGLIGCADLGYRVSTSNLRVQNMKVNGGTISATRSGLTNYSDTVYKNGLPSAGGIIGKVRGCKLSITDVTVLKVNLNADAVGGVIGCIIIPRDSTLNFERITVDGDLGNSTNASMNAWLHAGGVIGRIYAKNASTYTFNDIRVSNYDLISQCNAAYGTASGILGSFYAENNNNKSLQFTNLTVENCTLTADNTNAALSARKGVGGLLGAVSGSNGKTLYLGYNILINATIGGNGTNSFGAVVGNNVSNTAIIKVVGVSAQITTEKTLSATENNNGGYSVYADYNAAQTNQSFSTLDDTTTNSDNYTNTPANDPFVTANPSITIGGKKLTGDGVAASVATLPIQSILDGGANGRYAYAASAYYTGGSGETNFAAFLANRSKLAMFSSEATGYSGTDFPVLVIETTNEDLSHKIINSYLRLLTNTTFDYGTNVAGKYSVVIYNMTYANNAFTASLNNPSLKLIDGKFRMINTAYDSGKAQFSLIDVRFYDPTNTSKVAYHLYVPVFVKKVLTFRFDIAALSGTTYLASQYSSYGARLIENVGTPITLFFQYTYSRTAVEWEQAINSGENAQRNYVKLLLLNKANTNDVLKDFSGDTILVLVDRNDGGKAYYAKLSDALSGNTLDLRVFKSVMTKNGNNVTFSGDSFEPKKFSDLLTLTATVDNVSGTMVTCDAASATVIIGGQGYRLATDEELANAGIDKYTVSVGAIAGNALTESYYLSVFTEGAADYSLFHYFIVTSETSLSDLQSYPARISDTDAHAMVHLVMGKIFYHDGVSVSSSSGLGTLIMTDENNTLNVNLSVQLGVSNALGDLREEVKGYMNTTPVYQSFLIYLSRKEGVSENKAIVGNPTVSGRYNTDSVLNATADTATTNYANENIHVMQSFVEVVSGNLGSVFAQVGDDPFELNASVTLTYSRPGSVPAQFPGRNSEEANRDNGVKVSTTSNLAFSPTATNYSKNSVGCDESPANVYYSNATIESATLSLNPIGDQIGDFTPFGINGKSSPSERLDILATLDITSIIQQVEDYDDAYITVKLYQKQADGTYGSELQISDYIPTMTIGEAAATDEGTQYSAVIAKANLTDNGAEITLPELHLTVITGNAFETAGHTYGNFRLVVTMMLRDEGTEYAVSVASNYVIYTNAKVISSYIS